MPTFLHVAQLLLRIRRLFSAVPLLNIFRLLPHLSRCPFLGLLTPLFAFFVVPLARQLMPPPSFVSLYVFERRHSR